MPKSSKARAGCLICKARKVRCDNPNENCTPCTKMHLSCPGSIQTKSANDNKPTESELSKIVNETFRKAGRKRRLVGACQACQISKIRCERGRPCLRCEGRGISCVYFGEGRGGGSSADAGEKDKVTGDQVERDESEREGEWSGSRQDPTKAKEPFKAQVGRSLSTLEPLQTSSERQGYNWKRVRELCEIYFTQVHPLRCLSFIHKPSFMQALDAGRIMEDFGEALVYIICAFGERFSMSLRDGELNLDTGMNWAERAQELAFSNLGRPSVSNLMALVLLCEWHIRFGQESTAFMISGISSRLAQLLRLDAEPTEQSLHGIAGSLITAEKESRRRLVWSCYILDVTISSGVDLISNWPSVPTTRLPCSAREFTLQLECETGTLCEGSGFLEGLQKYNMCLEAYFVRIIYLRKQVLRLIRQNNSNTLSEFDTLVSHLEACGESFPRHLRLNEINAYVHEENNQLAAFYALHLLYNQCFCDLYRVSLPGYRFPLSEVVAREQPERVEGLRVQCVERAQGITNILGAALIKGTKGFIDSVCSICAYESSKIQVIYARTCMEEVDEDVERSIRTNLEALDIISGWDKKRDALISSLSKLLREFGFSDLAAHWLDRNNASLSSHAKEDAPPESHHLHPLALYRMSWKEISWPRKPDTNSRMLKTPQFGPSNMTSTERQTATAGKTAQSAGVTDMVDLPEGPASFNLEDFPNTEAITDIDSYLQMADDFSNYLTWDPWDFGYTY